MSQTNLLRRVLRIVALVTAIALGLCACAESANLDLEAPYGDHSRSLSGDVTLYCAASGSMELTCVTRTVRAGANESLLYAAMLELLNATPGGGSLLVGSAETQLIDVEFAGGIATVRLCMDTVLNRSDPDCFLLCASIANTLLGMNGVEAVNILTADRANAVAALPLGAFAHLEEDVAAAYAQIQAESGRFLQNGAAITRNAVLYFPSADGKWLLPEIRAIAFDSADFISPVSGALKNGPMARSGCFTAVPANLDLFVSAPEIRISETGLRVIELNLSPTLPHYLALAGVEPWQLYGSVALSLLSFVPDCDAVRMCVEDVYVTECALPSGRRARFADGLMYRCDFADCIGDAAAFYFAREDGGLLRLECPVSPAEAASAMGVLKSMISAGNLDIAGLQTVFPDGVTAEDVLGVALSDRVAIVNLSGRFYSRCQSLSASAERQLVYAMVNALCESDEIGAVSFRIEGKRVDTLAGEISFRTPLLPDPGLTAAANAEDTPE